MRKWLSVLLLLSFIVSFAGCSRTEKPVTYEEVGAAYEVAGYDVWYNQWDDQPFDRSIRATDPETGEYIYFHFFATPQEAKNYADTREYNVLIWLFTVIHGDPCWLTTVTYQNIEIEYDHSYLYEPFEKLIH